MNEILLRRLLILAAKYEIHECLYWKENLEFYINCNDFFFWACADAEKIETEEDINLLERSLIDAGAINGPHLYCARRRKMRPQGAYYKFLSEKNWQLFNEAGPEREINFCNPYHNS